jgi:hypothetical protein
LTARTETRRTKNTKDHEEVQPQSDAEELRDGDEGETNHRKSLARRNCCQNDDDRRRTTETRRTKNTKDHEEENQPQRTQRNTETTTYDGRTKDEKMKMKMKMRKTRMVFL